MLSTQLSLQVTLNTVDSYLILVDDLAYPIALKACSRFMNQTSCNGYLKRYIHEFLSNFFNHYSDGDFVCSYFNVCETKFRFLNVSEYAAEVLSDKPKRISLIPEPKKDASKSKFTIAHLSDIHINPHYAVGSNAFCDESNCCQSINGFPSNESQQAQYWGTVASCDIPVVIQLNLIPANSK